MNDELPLLLCISRMPSGNFGTAERASEKSFVTTAFGYWRCIRI